MLKGVERGISSPPFPSFNYLKITYMKTVYIRNKMGRIVEVPVQVTREWNVKNFAQDLVVKNNATILTEKEAKAELKLLAEIKTAIREWKMTKEEGKKKIKDFREGKTQTETKTEEKK